MLNKLRVATVGAGYFSQFHYRAWQRLEQVELIALCEQDQEKARRFAKTYGIPSIYPDLKTLLAREQIDLLDVITPPATHLEFVASAAANSVAVICQKPFTLNLQQAEQAVTLAEQASIPLVIHENFRFQPWYGQIQKLLQQGLIGTPYQITFRLRPGDGQGPDAYLDRQPYFQKMERFLVHETAIHLIDVFRFLFGKVSGLMARLNRLNPVIAGEDAGFIMFEFADGGRAVFDGNRLVDHAAENRRLTMGEMLLEGSAGVLRLDGDGRLYLRPFGSNEEQAIAYAWDNRDFGGDCVYRLQQHVVEHLCEGSPVMNTGREYLSNLRIEEVIYESQRTQRWISL